jgi:hypothetical protein
VSQMPTPRAQVCPPPPAENSWLWPWFLLSGVLKLVGCLQTQLWGLANLACRLHGAGARNESDNTEDEYGYKEVNQGASTDANSVSGGPNQLKIQAMNFLVDADKSMGKLGLFQLQYSASIISPC